MTGLLQSNLFPKINNCNGLSLLFKCEKQANGRLSDLTIKLINVILLR